MIFTLYNKFLPIRICFVAGLKKFHFFEIHGKSSHVDEPIFLGGVVFHEENIEPLNKHAIDVSKRYPNRRFVGVGLIVHVPDAVHALKFDKNVQNVLLLGLI